MLNIKKVCLYARVSSAGQAEKDLSIPSQLAFLKRYAADHDMQIVAEYTDAAETGTNANRPEFQKMMAAAKSKQRPFDTILVWKFSRAFRSLEDAVFYEALLNRKGMELISITEPVGTNAAGKFHRRMLHIVNELFSEQLGEDIRRGLAQAALEGSWCRQAPTGYKIVKTPPPGKTRNRLEHDATWAPIIRQIFELALEGHGAKAIANVLNAHGLRTPKGYAWSSTGVLSILRNEHYTGMLVFGKTRKIKGKAKKADSEPIRFENSHPPIVSREEFEQVRNMIAARTRHSIHPRAVGSKYLLSGLLRCGCGSAMTGHAFSNNRYQKYMCVAKHRSGSTVCTAANLDQHQLETAVLDKLTDFILAEANIREMVRLSNESLREREATDMTQALEAKLKTAKQEMERYLDAIRDGDDIPELKSRIRETRNRITKLEQQLHTMVGAAAGLPEALNEDDVMRQVYHLQHILEQTEPEVRKSILRSFVSLINVNLPDVTIQYSLPSAGRSAIDMTSIDAATTA